MGTLLPCQVGLHRFLLSQQNHLAAVCHIDCGSGISDRRNPLQNGVAHIQCKINHCVPIVIPPEQIISIPDLLPGVVRHCLTGTDSFGKILHLRINQSGILRRGAHLGVNPIFPQILQCRKTAVLCLRKNLLQHGEHIVAGHFTPGEILVVQFRQVYRYKVVHGTVDRVGIPLPVGHGLLQPCLLVIVDFPLGSVPDHPEQDAADNPDGQKAYKNRRHYAVAQIVPHFISKGCCFGVHCFPSFGCFFLSYHNSRNSQEFLKKAPEFLRAPDEFSLQIGSKWI